MQLAKLLPLFFLALPTQAATISSETISIIDSTKNLGGMVASWSGSVDTLFTILKGSSSLLAATNAATMATKGYTSMNILEATALAQSTQNVEADTRATLKFFVAAKDKFQNIGVKPDILVILKAQQMAAKAFSDAITEKTPGLFQAMANKTASSIYSAFSDAIVALDK